MQDIPKSVVRKILKNEEYHQHGESKERGKVAGPRKKDKRKKEMSNKCASAACVAAAVVTLCWT